MPLESCIVHLHLDGDHRLAAAVAGAVENCAGQAGFDAADRASLAAAAQVVCRGAVEQAAAENSPVDVTIECLADRVVIKVEHSGVAPAIGLDSLVSDTPEPGGAVGGVELLRDVDRIEFCAHDGRVLTTLVKYLPKKARAS